MDRLDRRGALLRPLAQLRLYVLDTQLLPVPVGLPGDLYVAGPGIGRGNGSPGSGGGRRLADPFDARGGSWMLRTGDRARRRSDGTIELLERS
jgi:non-ribosomal peptide synthetase component F